MGYEPCECRRTGTFKISDVRCHSPSTVCTWTEPSTPQSQPTGPTSESSQSSSSDSSSQADSAESGSSSAGEEELDSATSPGDEGEGKAYEVSKQSAGGVSESGLPLAALVGVIALVFLVGIGYFRGNNKDK